MNHPHQRPFPPLPAVAAASAAMPKPEAPPDGKPPPRPYTEYTIYFRLERARILQSSGVVDETAVPFFNLRHDDSLEFPRPAKFRHVAMPPYWYSSSHKAEIEKSRKHRKKEGRMNLRTLSKIVSTNWREEDQEVIDYCKKIARDEYRKYKAIVKAMKAAEPVEERKAPAPQEEALRIPVVRLEKRKRWQGHEKGQEQKKAMSPVASATDAAQHQSLLRMHQMQELLQNANAVGLEGVPSPAASAPSAAAAVTKIVASPPVALSVPNSPHSTVQDVSKPLPLSETSRMPFVRRASAPAEYASPGPYYATDVSGGFSCAGFGMQEEGPSRPPPQARRRSTASLPDADSQEMIALERMRVARQRHQEPEWPLPSEEAHHLVPEPPQGGGQVTGSFTSVPDWNKEQANEFLRVLGEPEDDDINDMIMNTFLNN